MAREVFVAVFDTVGDAERASSELEAAGIAAADIRIRGSGGEQEAPSRGGFLAWLFGSDSESHGAYYGEHLGSGRAVLSVAAESTDYDRIADILHRHDLKRGSPDGGMAAPGMSAGAQAGEAVAPAEEETVLPTAREELEVGKRRTADARAYRIRRYVVEQPAEQQVSLRDETVTVERRAPAQSAVVDQPFAERYVEVTEIREEPVVRKVVKPGEDVVVRKEARDRTETVRDTVRESKVEVDHAAAGNKPLGSQGE
jgi:stress response protein YsnF